MRTRRAMRFQAVALKHYGTVPGVHDHGGALRLVALQVYLMTFGAARGVRELVFMFNSDVEYLGTFLAFLCGKSSK